ncbi:MAG: tRNA lysidine(34) synthetase TilS [Bacteroides sp.]|nr:tRNA lysidine(34) synthetase TilS [Bacteroides sp.]MCM1448623.1 tRNA lysidine(34) synthetase TilS [Bacteroides sp.]
MTIQDLSTDGLYLVALSGGADSVALALMMKEQGLHCRAMHCNFHLRGAESDRDEQFVRDFCLQQDIPLEVKHFDTIASAKKHAASIEMEARELRYTWFTERAHHHNAIGICVAHHRDDQAETLLLNLIRGTGLRGLSAMHPDRTINGLRILRPLLNLGKDDILHYLHIRNQGYVTDSTNLERDAMRNKIRLDVIPLLHSLNPNITECLARTAHNVRMELDKDSQESHYHQWLAPLGFTRQQILDIYAHRPHDNRTTSRYTGKMWHSTTHTLLLNRGNWILEKRVPPSSVLRYSLVTDILSIEEHPNPKDFLNKEQAFLDADLIQGQLQLRRILPGDRFCPYGMHNGTKLVSDFLTDRKVNLLAKQSQLVAYDTATNAIVWVCGRDIDHRYRITKQTTRIMRLHLE